ncbi:MAG TPA: M1 family aminopeptidase [Longimicrobiaceae bacterium]
MRTRTIPALGALAAALALPAAPAAQHAPQAMGDTSVFRRLDLPAPNQYRSASGAPGPRYWQQRADHRIEASIDTASEVLTGRETVRYRNNSPDTLRFVWMQVDQNLYRPGSLGALQNAADSRWGARNFQGGMDIASARVNGREVKPYVYDTMMRLDLPAPLAPGGSTEIEVAWSYRMPEYGSDRTARRGDLYEIAQWFPRMAVYDDVSGWNTDPYLGQGEFYREFGDYDVRITVPAGFVVGATGTLQNPGEVLTAAQRERLARAARSEEQVAIIAADEVGTPGSRPRTTGTLTWHFRAENVHDFAWAASPRFRWDSESWDGIRCHALYQPDAPASWQTGADMTCFSIRDFSTRWSRYPWPQATSIAGPVGGMEYPMLVFVAGGTEYQTFNVIMHEHGHEWFPMIVSSNERRYAWMDEGFNSFIDHFAAEARYPGVTDPGLSYKKAVARQRYETLVAQGGDLPLSLPPDRIVRTALGVTAYRKPALMLHLLREEVLDPATFDAAFREYIRRWSWRHPTPADFFRTMEDVTGRDLDWFWRSWVYTNDVLDLGVAGVTQAADSANGGFTATVSLVRNTSVAMPVRLRLLLQNGQTQEVRLPEQIWYGGRSYSYVLNVPAQVVGAVIDPGNALPDQNRTNNAWGTARTTQ